MADTIRINDALLGVKLLERNVFRLAEAAVDTAPRALEQRLKQLEMATQLEGLAVPPGEVSVAPLNLSNLHEELKNALAQIKDPLHRFLHEFCWFWPPSYTNEEDLGWEKLITGHVDEAEQLWRLNSTLCAIHNLAVAATLEALQGDSSVEHWNEACRYWQATFEHNMLKDCLYDRVAAYADPRFTTDALATLHTELPVLVASFAAERVVALAEQGAGDLAELRESLHQFLPEDAVQRALERVSRHHRDRLRFLRRAYDKDVERDMLAAPALTAAYIDQCRRELDLLERIFGPDDDYLVSLADNVTDGLLYTQVAYCKDTQDWAGGIAMLELGLSVVRSEVERRQMTSNLEVLQENKEIDNDWVSHGYFNLPERIRERFESGRASLELGNVEAAVRDLRNILIDAAFEEDAQTIRQCVRHALAYTFRRAAIGIWNDAIDRYDEQITRLTDGVARGQLPSDRSLTHLGLDLFSSLATDRLEQLYQQPSGINCDMCGSQIYGDYFTRTVHENSYNHCRKCNNRINAAFNKVEREFAVEETRARELHYLARALNPDNAHLKRELATIARRQTKDVHPRSVLELAIEWQLLDMDTTIELLAPLDNSQTRRGTESLLSLEHAPKSKMAELFEFFAQAVSDLPSDMQQTKAQALFERLLSPNATSKSQVLRLLVQHDKMGGWFAQYCLDAQRHETGSRKVWLDVIKKDADIFSLLKQCGQVKSAVPPSDPIINQLTQLLYRQLRRYGRRGTGNTLHSDEFNTFLGLAREVGEDFYAAAVENVFLGQSNDSRRALLGLEQWLKVAGEAPVCALLDKEPPADVAPEHFANLLHACMLVNRENVQLKALAVATQKFNDRDLNEMLIFALGAKSAVVQNKGIETLSQRDNLPIDLLLESLYAQNHHQQEGVMKMLNTSIGRGEIPALEKLMSLALTLPDEKTAIFCRDLIRSHYAQWPQSKSAKQYLGWVKHTLNEGLQPPRTAALSLQEDFKKSGLFARFSALFVLAEAPPVEESVAWWTRPTAKSKRHRPAGAKQLPAGLSAPNDPKKQCPCGSGKRYENCHGIH
jgi:SEC-C motif-containing protein